MELIDQAFRETAHRVLITQSPLEVLEVADRIRIDLLVIYLADRDLRPTLVDEVRSANPSCTSSTSATTPRTAQQALTATAPCARRSHWTSSCGRLRPASIETLGAAT
jgi:hypothetical protein